jgi:RNA polymerase sigma-70 factor, ECF subfamily
VIVLCEGLDVMGPTSVSLLGRLQIQDDQQAWNRLFDLYTPLIRNWLKRHGVNDRDSDDLIQEVLTVVIRRYPEFQHNERTGAFRAWLKSIAFNVSRDFWKANRIRPKAPGGTDFGQYLDQLANPDNPLSQAWNREHDLHITRKLMELIRDSFAEKTWLAFERVTLDGITPDEVAKELGITVNAVFIAKSRVLAKMREEADGLVEMD